MHKGDLEAQLSEYTRFMHGLDMTFFQASMNSKRL